jgi:hypothetical protein
MITLRELSFIVVLVVIVLTFMLLGLEAWVVLVRGLRLGQPYETVLSMLAPILGLMLVYWFAGVFEEASDG